MIGDVNAAKQIYIVCGYTDMRKSIDGLAGIVAQNYGLDIYSKSLFLFCGRSCNKMKALLWEDDGFVLLYKKLSGGKYRWPRSSAEVKELSRQEFRWLLEGLSVEQKTAIKPSAKGKIF